MKRLASILILILLFSPPLTATLADGDTICFLRIVKLVDTGHSVAENSVITTQTEWQTLWDQIFSITNEKPPLPEIDFTRRTIVAVFQGEQATSGYEISIQEIIETENSIEVVVKAVAPGSRCGVLDKVTRPLDIVEIEKTAKQIVFHVKHKIRNCG